MPVFLIPVLIIILSACQADTDAGSSREMSAETEISLAQSVLTPAQTDTEQQDESVIENRHPVTVTLAHGETGMAAQALQALAASFNGVNTTGITVEIAGIAPEAENADIVTVADDETQSVSHGADMIILDADGFRHAADSAAALDDLISAVFDNYEDILQPFRDQAVLSGVTRGIPLDAEGSVLYYNRELLEELELSVPDTAGALADCGRTLMDERNIPFLCSDDPAGIFELFLRQNGTDMIAGNRTVFENAEGRKTMQMLLPVLERDYLVYCGDGRSAGDAFLEKRAAAYIGGHTGLTLLADADFEIGCAPVFRGETMAVPARARMLAVTTTDTDKQAGCFAFIRYLTSADINAKWAVAAGRLPVRNSAFRSDMFTGYTEYDDAAKAAAAGTEAFYVPAECDDYTGGIIRSLLEDYAARGVMSDEACRALAEELNTVLSAE